MLQGQTRPADGRPADPVRAGARWSTRSTACSTSMDARRRTSRSCTLLASYAYQRAQERRQRVPAGRGAGRPVRAREARRSCSPTCRRDYIQITSGLGEAPPLNIIVLPVLFEGEVKAVIELASFERFSPTHQAFLDQLTESIGIVLNTIEANMRTEELLKQSQSLAQRAAEPAGGAAADQRGAARRRRGCSPSRTTRSSARTARSSRPARRSRRRPSSSR